MQCQIVASSDLQSHGGFPGSVSPRAGGGAGGEKGGSNAVLVTLNAA